MTYETKLAIVFAIAFASVLAVLGTTGRLSRDCDWRKCHGTAMYVSRNSANTTDKGNTNMATDKAKTSNAPDVSSWATAGRNVRFITMDGLLFIAVDISKPVIDASPVSGSGKSRSVGSTLGNVAIPGTSAKLGVNVYTPVSG